MNGEEHNEFDMENTELCFNKVPWRCILIL